MNRIFRSYLVDPDQHAGFGGPDSGIYQPERLKTTPATNGRFCATADAFDEAASLLEKHLISLAAELPRPSGPVRCLIKAERVPEEIPVKIAVRAHDGCTSAVVAPE